MADMDKLMEFLQKEVPSNAGDLNNSINTTLDIIERTRAAVSGTVPKLYQNGRHDEVNNFTNADRQLMEIENYLKKLVGATNINNSREQFSGESISNKPTESKTNYDSYKVDETEPHNLDEDFTNKRPTCFSLEGKRYSVRNWNRLLVMVCEILNKQNSNLFQSFPDDESMQGRTRTYFSRKQMKYACKKIGGTDIYVLTNNNGNGNCSIIIKMLEKYNIPTTSMEIFLKADYSPLREDDENVKKKLNIDNEVVEEQKKNINEVTVIKIGQVAKEYFTKYFSDTSKKYNLKNFLNRDWCHDTFGICYPLLKEVDMTIPISKQKGYNNNYGRYWTKTVLEINSKHYIICSQWFKEFQGNLDKWIAENPISDISDSKMPIYILPNAKTKICQKCGNKTEREILYVTYHTAIADINNKLFTRRCKNCKTTYMADTIFKSYTRSKDIGNINVNFIKQDT